MIEISRKHPWRSISRKWSKFWKIQISF